MILVVGGMLNSKSANNHSNKSAAGMHDTPPRKFNLAKSQDKGQNKILS